MMGLGGGEGAGRLGLGGGGGTGRLGLGDGGGVGRLGLGGGGGVGTLGLGGGGGVGLEKLEKLGRDVNPPPEDLDPNELDIRCPPEERPMELCPPELRCPPEEPIPALPISTIPPKTKFYHINSGKNMIPQIDHDCNRNSKS